ncbi:branched-chain amino acid aminotransferase II [Aaosphaeria arxii CBS 175.79]|uniref:Branched-chain amino acid aminotransferase II n=1 Tax=Aaosphaeria arxii CBS 175.79 TaxID=1450172 RepID=A0A6A5XRB4_9PLEO|nr:branched-chain amino acid aminotransferase II [Aaosphaeria arxii CBS 175.79]KAF2015722.1 branched-chain amino acid aminotransferase II [Aaosphaeria arxii CBS 175.79]
MAAYPPPPVNTIDWNNVGFKIREVAGHVESTYSKQTGKWTAPTFVEDPFLRIHGMAPGLNYGQQCYEGMKAFRAPDGNINIFRPNKNAERMQHSASFISIPEVPTEHFLECCKLAVGMNAAYVPPHETGAAMYIRPLLFGSSAQLGLNPPEEYTFVVYVIPTGVYHGTHPVDALILEDFDRAAPEGTGSAKVGGNYAPVLRWSEKAHKDGYGITLHLDSKTRSVIDEFSTSAFIGVKKDGGKVKLVASNSKNVIQSVTADSILRIGESLGWETESREIPYTELSSFSEVLAAGTAAALVPIRSITYTSKNEKFAYKEAAEEPGPACVKLLSTLKGLQQGKIQDSFGWLFNVEKPKQWGVTKGKAADEENVDELP